MITHVISYLEAAAAAFPDRVALASETEELTYRQVWEKTCAAGSEIFRRLGSVRQTVLVCIRHVPEDILAFFGTAWAGNCYVPLDLSLPPERLRSIARTISPAAVIVPRGTELPFDVSSMQVWDPGELTGAPGEPVFPWRDCKDTDPLYVIFTSGSSGVPKGVAVSHRSVIDMAEQFQAVFRFPSGTVFGNQAPFDFDVSVKDIYLSLKTAGRLEILEKKLFSFPALLIRRMNLRKIDTVIWAVPALKVMAALKAFSRERPEYLKNIMFSGEVLPPKTLAYFREMIPEARYVNLYGPTEITCNCTYHVLSPEREYSDSIPIGQAFPNCSVLLLDGNEPVTRPEVPGELCVTGSCLALGYYRQPEETETAFVRNPLEPALPEKMYRTGDMACFRNGELYYLGRKDSQIKHMGHRIELQEIELSANRTEGVAVSACVYDPETACISLFYQGEAEADALREQLSQRLPRYMVPARLVPMEAFPLTRTGKIDRKQLLQIAKGAH